MNVDDTVRMVKVNLLLQRPRMLASIVAVTFVGKGKLSKLWLKSAFCVRRRRIYVHEALLWLKEHNCLYTDIEISATWPDKLPKDDIPKSILTSIWQEENDDVVAKELEMYVLTDKVPNDCACESWKEGPSKSTCLPHGTQTNTHTLHAGNNAAEVE